MSEEKNILREAGEIVDGDRGRFYGHPAENHGNTGELWAAYLRRKFGVKVDISARDVCMMMVLLKVSRDANAPKRDNLVDIAGYARNAEMIVTKEKQEEDSQVYKVVQGPVPGLEPFSLDNLGRPYGAHNPSPPIEAKQED